MARALVTALFAESPTVISGALRCRDTDLMQKALQAFGATIISSNHSGESSLKVVPPRRLQVPAAPIQCGLSGTVMRFLPPVAALLDQPVRFEGDAQASQRPMAGALAALSALGAEVIYHDQPGHLPFTICGPLRPNRCQLVSEVQVDASASSQFLSGLLLSAGAFGFPVRFSLQGRLPSLPHVEMTVKYLKNQGVKITSSYTAQSVPAANTAATRQCTSAFPDLKASWQVQPSRPVGKEVQIEPDLTNAGPFLAAALITRGEVTIKHWPPATTQPGDKWQTLIPALGGQCHLNPANELVVSGVGTINGIEMNLQELGELTPTLAALAVMADSPSKLSGLRHLRGHETDRLAALETEINRLGGKASSSTDSLTIIPTPLQAATLHSYHDHRMAMFGAILGLAVPGVKIRNMATVSKTFPDFVSYWQYLVAP